MARKDNVSSETVDTAVEVQKFASVVILPIQRGLPNGQILVCAIHGDTLAGTKQYQMASEQELNEKLNGIIRTSAETGYSLEIIVAARVHYRTTLRQFSRDPLSAVEYCRQFTVQRQDNQQAPGEDLLPF